MRDGWAHRILSVHLDPLPSAAVTTSVPRRPRPRPSLRSRLAAPRPSPRALSLAASIGWQHATADPVRALLLAWRALPAPLRGWLRLAGPYGRATVLWGAGERDAALAALTASPRRLAAFSLAADQPATAAAALARLPEDDRSRPALAARLAWEQGQLTEALNALDGARASRARRLRATLAEQSGQSMIVNSFGQITAISVHDHGLGRGSAHPRRRGEGSGSTRHGGGGPAVLGRVLHLVTDALPTTSAGYTIRTHEIALAQRAAGLDPHVATRCGYPVTQGRLDGRRLVVLDGVPYHRLLPWRMPGRADAVASCGLELAAGLTSRIRPAVLHAASNFANARLALALRERYGLPVVYEVRGFWEDTWLSRHPDAERLAKSELYQQNRDLETRCMLAADLVVTLGEAMREEILARGVAAEKILIVPNAVAAEFLRPLPDAAALRAALGIDPDEYVVGVVSSLVPHEGIGTLLEATAILRARRVPARALIVGDGPERAALQRQAAVRAFQAPGHDSRLGQVVDNLIENARSFSPPGGTVRITCRRVKSNIEICVDDDGPGVRPDALEKVFERFYTDRPHQGFGQNSGLGLSISKQIVEAHGGAIWVENRIGMPGADGTPTVLGARFIVRLPAM